MPPEDLISRFTETPLEAMLAFSGIVIRMKTNCQAVADGLRRAFTPCTAGSLLEPDIILKVVAESEDDSELEAAATLHRLSHDGLFFISLGRKSFIACDRQTREAISFVSPSLITDEKRFSQHFLPALIAMLEEFMEAPF
jgi:hypothetical protein